MFRVVLTIAVFALVGLAQSPINAQDFGYPDTITLVPTTLAVGESRPIEIWLANDEVIAGIQFTFLFKPVDAGFARIDSIVGLGRLLDPSVLSRRLISWGQINGVPPDTVTIALFEQASNQLPIGSGPILAMYVSGVTAGMMRVDTATTKINTRTTMVTPGSAKIPFVFNAAVCPVTIALRPPTTAAPTGFTLGIAGENIRFNVSSVSPYGAPVIVSLVSMADFEDTSRLPVVAPGFDNANPGEFSWTPGASDLGIWLATFRGTDSSGLQSDIQVRMQVVSAEGFNVPFAATVSDSMIMAKSIIHGDFNGDNRPEVAVAGWLLPGAPFPVASYSFSADGQGHLDWGAVDQYLRKTLVTGFLGADEHLDLATSTPMPGGQWLYKGNGDNTFTRYDQNSPVVNIRAAVLLDFDHDDALDMAGVTPRDVIVLTGQLDADFQTAVSIPSADLTISVNAADFNQDGWDDLAVGTRAGLDIYLNNQSRGLVKTYHYDQFFGVADIDITNQGSDFNDDGRYDLCLATPSVGGLTSQLMVYLGNPDGSFEQHLVRSVAGQIFANCVGDFNGDTYLDIAFINGAKRYLSILFGDGAGDFVNEVRYDIPRYEPFLMDCMDIDVDGDLDIVVNAYHIPGGCDLVLFTNQLNPGAHLSATLKVASEGNAEVEITSPGGAKLNKVMNAIASASSHLKAVDTDSRLDEIVTLASVQSGAYSIHVRPRPDFRQGTPFGLSYKIGSVAYRVAASVPMPHNGYTFSIYPDGSSPITPTLGEYIQNQLPTFTWSGSGRFEFELSHDAAFAQMIEQQTLAGATYTSKVPLPQSVTTPYYWRVRPVGETTWSGFYSFNVSPVPTDVNDPTEELPLDFSLSQNYPNPFNPSTVISFSLPKPSQVRIEIFNVIGQTIASLADKRMDAGQHSIEWNGRDWSGNPVSSGVYFYRLTSDGFTQSKKMVLLR